MANRIFNQFLFSFTKMLVSIHGIISIVQAVKATITAQGMTYTADAFGADGNSITVTLTGGGTAGAEVVTVVGTAISVQIESGVTTQTQLKTALDGAAAAAALIDTTVASGATPVNAAAAVTLAGGVDGVASTSIRGATVERSGVGEYTVTLDDKYYALMGCFLQVESTSAIDKVGQIVSHDVSGAKTIVFKLLTAATASEIAAPIAVHFNALLRNSSVVK